MPSPSIAEPERGCGLCPRLAGFRADNAAGYPAYFNAPVPSFGAAGSPLLIVGLAPGLHGANRTGRPFTGDGAGEVLYGALDRAGVLDGIYGAAADDGLALRKVRIANAVRCVPPQNKPIPAEIRTCNPYLASELSAVPEGGAILALGRIAHDAVAMALAVRKKDVPFAHGAVHALPGRRQLFDSYHCSRYNMNTGGLTAPMLDAVLEAALRSLR